MEALTQNADVLLILKFDPSSVITEALLPALRRPFFNFAKKRTGCDSRLIRLISVGPRAGQHPASLLWAERARRRSSMRQGKTIAHIHASGYFYGKVPFGDENGCRRPITLAIASWFPDPYRFALPRPVIPPQDESLGRLAAPWTTSFPRIGTTSTAAFQRLSPSPHELGPALVARIVSYLWGAQVAGQTIAQCSEKLGLSTRPAPPLDGVCVRPASRFGS